MTENSPAIHGWVHAPEDAVRPEGTAEKLLHQSAVPSGGTSPFFFIFAVRQPTLSSAATMICLSVSKTKPRSSPAAHLESAQPPRKLSPAQARPFGSLIATRKAANPSPRKSAQNL